MGSVQRKSLFSGAEFIPPDAIFEVTRRLLEDKFPDKVNLGQGTYRDENGQPWILPAVRIAEQKIAGCGHEYLAIAGLKELRTAGMKLAFHDTKALAENRVASCQALSGTGALLLAGMALKRAGAGITKVYITDPTWSNHHLLFSSMGYEVHAIPYYKDRQFDFASFLAKLKTTDAHSAVVLHACAHNPTGCDPTQDQWRAIATTIAETGAFPIFDAAYLGFNSGSVDVDAWAIRHFVEDCGLEAAVCLSFAKSMGLYGERTGLVTIVTGTPATAHTMDSILENVQRATVSSPPAYGARLAAAVLNDPETAAQWSRDLVTMSTRIQSMRTRLYDELVRLGTPGDWSHIVKQTGMFGYLEIASEQVEYLEEHYHVYMANTSRISMAGLNDSNVVYFATALDQTVRRASKSS